MNEFIQQNSLVGPPLNSFRKSSRVRSLVPGDKTVMTGWPCTTVVQDSAEWAGVITRLAVCLAELKSQRLLIRTSYFFRAGNERLFSDL